MLRVRRSGTVSLLVVFLAGSLVVLHASPSGDVRPAPPDSRTSLMRVIERDAPRLVQAEQTKRRGPGPATHGLPSCNSRKKGAFVGAIIGAAAGGVFVAVLASQVDGLSADRDFGKFALTFMAAGAGAGALVGLVHCR